MTDGSRGRHRRQLLIFTLCSQVSIQLLLFLCSYLPLFDSSPWTILEKSTTWWATSSLLRWDVFHLGSVAEERIYEHQWAFFPGIPNFMKLLGKITPNPTWTTLLHWGVMSVIACDSTLVLYELSLRHLNSPSLSFLSAVISLLPSSPATLRHAPYAEPFFTWASYRGVFGSNRFSRANSMFPRHVSMCRFWVGFSLRLFQSRWGLPFERHSALRVHSLGNARGALRQGENRKSLSLHSILYSCSRSSKLAMKRIPYALLLTSLVYLPMIYHQYSGYRVFCQDTNTPAPWCSNFPPSIYTHVQAKYWNVGFLRYWSLQQAPNFLLAGPVTALLSYYSAKSVRSFVFLLFRKSRPGEPSPFESQSLIPHGIHAFIFTLILLFASHTQIILRFAASLPFTYWSAAQLVFEHPRLGKWWVGWSVVWGTVSLVLWSTFLPPA